MISDVFLDHSTFAEPPSRWVTSYCLTIFNLISMKGKEH